MEHFLFRFVLKINRPVGPSVSWQCKKLELCSWHRLGVSVPDDLDS